MRTSITLSKALRAGGARVVTAVGVLLLALQGHAQGPGVGAPPAPPPQSARESAPIELTGYWVAIVNEDWRWRMMTPPKGDYASILTLNPRGRAEADTWDPSQDGSCKAFGAVGLLRMPTRVHISWRTDAELELETDAGKQTRSFRFAPARASIPDEGIDRRASHAPSLQGNSVAEWNRTLPPPGPMGLPLPPGMSPPTQGGSLKVTTTDLAPGWLRRNGVPYSDRTELTEYFDAFKAPNGDEWLVVTTIVMDPVYQFDRYITSSHFRREPDDRKWNPTPCLID
jgi:hypothetical protein